MGWMRRIGWKTIMVERNEEIDVSLTAGGMSFEIVMMDQTGNRRQAGEDYLGVNSRGGGRHMTENAFLFAVLQRVLGV